MANKKLFQLMRASPVICKTVIAITTLLIVNSVANAQHGCELLIKPRTRLPTYARAAAVNSGLIEPAQVIAMARKTFPNKSQGLDDSELFRWIQSDPNHMGQLRGRLAEKDFFMRNPRWNPVKSKIASQNDGWRWVNGVVGGRQEHIQIKVRSYWKDYYSAMQTDDEAKFFAIPDDHFDAVHGDLESRRRGAIRGGQTAKAARYAHEEQRLIKLGRTFEQLDRSIKAAGPECEPLIHVAKSATMLQNPKYFLKDGATLRKASKALRSVRSTTAVEEMTAVATGAAAVEEITAGAAEAATVEGITTVAATEGAEIAGGFALGDFIAEGGWLLLLCW